MKRSFIFPRCRITIQLPSYCTKCLSSRGKLHTDSVSILFQVVFLYHSNIQLKIQNHCPGYVTRKHAECRNKYWSTKSDIHNAQNKFLITRNSSTYTVPTSVQTLRYVHGQLCGLTFSWNNYSCSATQEFPFLYRTQFYTNQLLDLTWASWIQSTHTHTHTLLL
jgi:hypothetical protein